MGRSAGEPGPRPLGIQRGSLVVTAQDFHHLFQPHGTGRLDREGAGLASVNVPAGQKRAARGAAIGVAGDNISCFGLIGPGEIEDRKRGRTSPFGRRNDQSGDG